MAEYIDKEAAIKTVSENDYEGYATIAIKAIPAADVRENTIRTQADHIRAMSDEELAEFIGGIYTLERDAWGDYDPCVVVEQSVKIRDKDDMLDWLKQEAQND